MTHIPIIVGAAQYTQGCENEEYLDPLHLMIKTGALAINDAKAKNLVKFIDSVWVVNILSWGYKNLPAQLAEKLSLTPSDLYYSTMSGHTPVNFVNKAAIAIARGQTRGILMAGGEAQYTAKRVYKKEITVNWPNLVNPEKIGDGKNPSHGTNSLENIYQLMLPINMYAMFETALRKAKGASLKEHVLAIGRMYERFSATAAKNPYAWDKNKYSAVEISTPGPDNPIACHPYTRRMTANMNVDMSASLVMTSEHIADKLGINREKWVYPMGGSNLENIPYVTQRPKLDDSPALREAARFSLKQAGMDISDIDVFDLYSCFPSMVEIACRELGISEDDKRPLTVTGGLPFFGGPMGNYSMHAIAGAVALIRKNPSMTALITANGGFNTRHSIGIYGKKAPAIGWDLHDHTAIQKEILEDALPEPVNEANGALTVDAYIIRENHTGQPARGLVCGRLKNGRRTLAHIDADAKTLARLAEEELVGRTGKVRFDPESGRNQIILEY